MDIRQSEMYVEYMRRIGWVVEKNDGTQIFIKRLPLIGSFIKIQRPDKIPSMEMIDGLARKYRAWSISVEQKYEVRSKKYEANGFKVNNNPYLPTKTIQIDLTMNEDQIFQRFTEAKRRAVRRAVKNTVVVQETDGIEEFVKLKAKNFWPLGFLMGKDVRALWESFRPKNASVLLAYCHCEESAIGGRRSNLEERLPRHFVARNDEGKQPIAGVLLLFYDEMAYYWMAASSNEGKKLFAPTLLVWEALKLVKKKGCTIFDFEGIYDDRFIRATRKWKGFTKFKEGFGGKEVLFPKPLIRRYRRAF